MSSISIIGTGNMARSIGALAVAGGNTVEVIGRDQSKAADLAKALGGSATTGEFGAVPAGDIVIVSLLYANVIPVVAQYGDALAGKVIVDICNPVNAAADGLATPDGTSSAQEVAKAAPASATRGRRPSTPPSVLSWPRANRSTSSSPATTQRPRRAWRSSSTASSCAHSTSAA